MLNPSVPVLPFAPTPLRHAVALALCGVVAWSAMPSTARAQAAQAQAQAQAQQRNYRIAAGPLAPALHTLASEAGVALMFTPAQTDGKTTHGLNGGYTLAQAYATLLAGSGLQAVLLENGSYVLRAAAPAPAPAPTPAAASHAGATPATLATVNVHAQLPADGRTEDSGSYTSGRVTTGTGLALSLRETPQSVTVFTRQKMDDLGIQSVEDMAQHTTGLTISRGAPQRTVFLSRGFEITNIVADGVPMSLNSDVYGPTTLSMYDHAEILRGAAGLTVGSGQPSGVISLTRKRPGKENKVVVSASAGSWDNYRAEFDAGGALNAEGTLRGRVVVARHDAHTFTDHYSHDRELYYGTLEADLAPATTLSVGASYNKENNKGAAWYGLPTAEDGSFLPIGRSANYTPPWAYWNKENQRVFADLEHKFDNGWQVRVSAYAVQMDMDALFANTTRVTGTDNLQIGWVGTGDYTQKQRGLQAIADGPFALFGRKHQLIVGATTRHMDFDNGGKSATYRYVYQQNDWQALARAPLPVFSGNWGPNLDKNEQTGVYGATRLNLSERLKVIAGSRLDRYKASSSGSLLFSVKNKVVPYAGAVYDINDNYSAYASWTRVFNPQDYRGFDNAVLAPLGGTNAEAGIKGEFFGGALTTSAAIFQSRLTNLPIQLDVARCRPGLLGCFGASGAVKSEGVEFEAHGQLSPGWQVGAGYTYNSAHYVEDSDAGAAGTRYRPDQPRHLFKLATTYRLPGAFKAAKIGASLRTQNMVFKDSPGARIQQGGYSVVDLHGSWQVSPQLELQFNLNNLTDKYYYESLGWTNSSNGWGAPRNVLVTARYQF